MLPSHYQRLIIEITKCTLDEAIEVEDIMRHDVFHSTLDWQTKAQFRAGAKKAFSIYQQIKDLDI